MANRDYYRERNTIASARLRYAPNSLARDIDHELRHEGYPAPRGHWAQIMRNGVPTQHLVIALARVFACDPYDVLPPVFFRDLEECRLRDCPEHGQNGA